MCLELQGLLIKMSQLIALSKFHRACTNVVQVQYTPVGQQAVHIRTMNR